MTVLLPFLWCLRLYWPNQKPHLEKGGHGALLTFSLPLENIDFFFTWTLLACTPRSLIFFSPQESKFMWIDTIIKDIYIFFLLIKRELQYRKPMGGRPSEHQRKPEKGTRNDQSRGNALHAGSS